MRPMFLIYKARLEDKVDLPYPKLGKYDIVNDTPFMHKCKFIRRWTRELALSIERDFICTRDQSSIHKLADVVV